MTTLQQAVHPLCFNLGITPGVSAMFPEGELPARLTAARAHGFEGVEGAMPTDAAAMRRLLDENDMRFVCMSFARGDSQAGELGLAALPGRQADFRNELLRAIESAVDLGCRMIHPRGGLVRQGQEQAYRAVYLDNISVACEEASRAGLQVLIEPICAARQPRYILQTHAAAIDIIGCMSAANLRVLLDMYHASLAGESAAALCTQHAGRIGLIQVADAPVRRQPPPRDKRLRETLEALAANKWHGWVSAEYVPEGPTGDSLAWTSLLSQVPIKAFV